MFSGIATNKNTQHEAWQSLVEHGLEIICLLPSQPLPAHDPHNPLVIFKICDITYAVPARHVAGVQALGTYTPLPFTQPFIVGLARTSHKVLMALHACPERTWQDIYRPDSVLLVINLQGLQVGLLADCIITGPPLTPAAYQPDTSAGISIASLSTT
jgi:hypothetical protein